MNFHAVGQAFGYLAIVLLFLGVRQFRKEYKAIKETAAKEKAVFDSRRF